jgi:hypothetical protein
MSPSVHAWTRDQVIATWESVIIVVYRFETTMSGAAAAQEVFDALAREHRDGAFVLTVVEENAPMPTPEVRAMMARFLATRAPQIILSAVVYEGTGFRAAAVRSLVTGLALVSKLPYRHKVFATVDEAASWFRSNSPVAGAWPEHALSNVVAEARNPFQATSSRAPG